MNHDPITDTLADLETGFTDLVASLRDVVHVLREENLVLRARLDERRLILAEPRAGTALKPCPVCGEDFPGDRRRKMCKACRSEQARKQIAAVHAARKGPRLVDPVGEVKTA